MTGKWNAGIYIRVSTTKQEAENQKIVLTKFANNSKWGIHDYYIDVISGKEDKRPEYDRLFREAHQKQFNLVLFWDLSRFSRSGMTFTVLKLNELHSLGIAFHSYQEPMLNTDNELIRNIIIAVMSSLAKIQAEKISDNTKLAFCKDDNGITIARKSGKKVGRSTLPQKTIDEVMRRLALNEPYSKIHNEVEYKTKFGKIHRISKGKISEIANPCSKKGCQK